MARPHILLRMRGSLLNSEQWSVNPTFAGNFTDASPNQADLNDWAAAVGGQFVSGGYGGIQAAWSSSLTLEGLDAYYYAADGSLETQGTWSPAQEQRGTGSINLPPATSIVASLQTGLPGRSARGRLYWPALGLSVNGANGGINPTTAQALATQTAAMLAMAENQWTGPAPIFSCVWSGTKQDAYAITAVRVGSQLDSQRRRRKSLAETYVTANMPA